MGIGRHPGPMAGGTGEKWLVYTYIYIHIIIYIYLHTYISHSKKLMKVMAIHVSLKMMIIREHDDKELRPPRDG